jgi:phenylpropionate dioxygenase-like ring-hydroxylating dioxygenase large terminal subunit
LRVTDRSHAATGSWVRVARSDDVPAAGVRDVSGAPEDLVVWRTFDGQACVMTAQCPHQWSHLGAEGVVDGDELVCASHFWRFAVDGRGTKVTIAGRRDQKADIEVFSTRETGGWIEAYLPAP